MKKGVNIFWILTVLVSIAIIILSSLECVEGVSYSMLPISDDIEPIGKSCNLFSLVCIPTVVSVVILFFDSKTLNVLASVALFIQAIVVTFSYKVYKHIDNLFSYIGSRSFTYKMTEIGIIVSFLCWIVFLLAIVLTYARLRGKKDNLVNIKTTKIIITILSVLLVMISIPVLMLRIGIVTEISIPFGLLFFILTATLIFFTYYYPIRKTLKTNNRKYLWIMIIVMIIFLIQIIFKDKIIDIWNDLFRTLIGPGSIPSPLDDYR